MDPVGTLSFTKTVKIKFKAFPAVMLVSRMDLIITVFPDTVKLKPEGINTCVTVDELKSTGSKTSLNSI